MPHVWRAQVYTGYVKSLNFSTKKTHRLGVHKKSIAENNNATKSRWPLAKNSMLRIVRLFKSAALPPNGTAPHYVEDTSPVLYICTSERVREFVVLLGSVPTAEVSRTHTNATHTQPINTRLFTHTSTGPCFAH